MSTESLTATETFFTFDPGILEKRLQGQKTLKFLKNGILIYFLLLIFEGALRKWILPALSNPLLIIRDPVALWLIALAWKEGYLRVNLFLTCTVFIGFISFFAALFLGHGNLFVAIYGARILLIQFPFIFVIGSVYTKEDVLKMGRLILWISIPMAILITLQFYSPQTAWVNKGLGDSKTGAGFSGALGYFRPPGTFSFITGTTQFFGLLACFVFYFWINTKAVNKLILTGATLALFIAVPFSISRTLFYEVGFTLLFFVISVVIKPGYLVKFIGIAALIIVLVVLLSQTEFLKAPIEAFTSRFTGATKSEGGVSGTLGDRYLGGMLRTLSVGSSFPFFGYGIGMGTSVAGSLLTGSRVMVIYAEDEWARVIGEMGLLFGLLFIFLRVGFCLSLLKAAISKLRLGETLPWLLLSFCLLMVPNGQWGQPTSLGFAVLIGGLTLASLNLDRLIPAHAV